MVPCVFSCHFPSLLFDYDMQLCKIKTSYKAFAAIPTNTLLQEQKALDEPIKAEEEAENRVLDTHSENQSDSSPSSVQNILDSNIGKANLYVSGSAVPEGPKTKPGVIRPTIVKAKIMVQEEEPVQPNPFKKYLEETNDPETEQDSSVFQPFFHTKLNPSTKSPLYPQQASSHADPLTPGPLNHLGSILRDNHDNSYSLYYRNTLYNKPNHPIVPIPENEALSSEEGKEEKYQNAPYLTMLLLGLDLGGKVQVPRSQPREGQVMAGATMHVQHSLPPKDVQMLTECKRSCTQVVVGSREKLIAVLISSLSLLRKHKKRKVNFLDITSEQTDKIAWLAPFHMSVEFYKSNDGPSLLQYMVD
ncbi:Muscular LMNA-interacting protein [Varanus komodoensis]|nr:Muscular LMNA-interacting protein [Varanus komodoensis]